MGPSKAPITIGASLSLTGTAANDFSADGQAFERGYQLWARDVNAHGGLLGRPVKLVILNDDSSPNQVVTNYQTLLGTDRVDLAFGPFSSLLTAPASSVAARYGMAFVEGAGGAPSVFDTPFNQADHNVFDVSLPVADELVPFVSWIASLPRDQRPKTAAYPMAQDPFADPPVQLAQTMLSRLGVQTVYTQVFPEQIADYKSPAEQVAGTKASLVVLGSTDVPTVAAFMQAFEQQHYTPKLFIAAAGPDQGAAFTSAVGAGNADGMMVPDGWYPGYANATSQNMVKEYVAQYGGTASGVNADVAEAYSVGQVMAQAVTATGGTSNAKIISYLHSGATLNSVQGPVKFDALGENGAAAAFIFQWDKNNFTQVLPAGARGGNSIIATKPAWPAADQRGHGMADRRTGTTLRAGYVIKHAKKSTVVHSPRSRGLTMQDWPVSWRLIAVIVVALVMGLVFGGLRVAAAANSAAGFGRVSQLANLGQQVTGLVQALEDERDQTTGVIPASSPKAAAAAVQHWYDATDAAAAKVRVLAAGIGGSFPANIQARVATVLSVLTHLGELRSTAQASQSALAVIADYSGPISDMLALNGQMAQGTADSGLANGVQALNSLSMAKDQATQQRAILYNALTQQLFADDELQALTTAESEQAADLAAFGTTATSAEQSSFRNTVAGPQVNRAELIEEYVLSVGSLDTGALAISPAAAPAQWYSAMSDTVGTMQTAELGIARSIVSRSQSLQRGAERSAEFTALLTALILLLVLIATAFVARSLVLPLRRLRAGALDIATVQLPERVRQLGEALDPATSMEVAPIDVMSADEIGQVARAFDQVHSEAVRLAGNEAMLRSSFNAMFVNLSRRSQSLIERLARTIDSLEQNEEDPDRLSSLFAMDHMVTRMRRNSENLLLLAGHESARKWSEPVPLAAVAQAATAEIEQYRRVTLNIRSGVAVSGQAVSDIVHLLAEIIENATVFSPKDSLVRVSAQELSSGGVLIEVSDSGVGISDARLGEINRRLDNPPIIDESVSRHMGLFAVAHLAERHGARVRLRAGAPQGLTALVWLPDSLTERIPRTHGEWTQPPAVQAGLQARRMTGRHGIATHTAQPGQRAGQPDAGAVPAQTGPTPAHSGAAPQQAGPVPAQGGARTHQTVQADSPETSDWFRSRRPSVPGTAGNGSSPPGPAPQTGGSRTAPQTGGSGPAWRGEWAEGRHAARIIADPVRGDRTVAGLPVRVPQANLIRGSAGSGRPADSGVTGRPPRSHETPAPAAPQPQRSPEMARSLLSGFQRGAHRAEGRDPRTGEGADR